MNRRQRFGNLPIKSSAFIIPTAKLTFGKGHSYFKYDSDVQVFKGAQLLIGRCSTNIGLKIVCAEKIVIGNDVHIGRDVWKL